MLSCIQSGKGVGWKAPPKVVREPLKQPTQGQADAAKRLSQGLSVAPTGNSVRQRSLSGIVQHNGGGGGGGFNNSSYSVVLDPQEYNQLQAAALGAINNNSTNNGANSMAAMQQLQQQQYLANQQQQGGGGAVAGTTGAYLPVYGGVYTPFNSNGKQEAMWPSSKASRCVHIASLFNIMPYEKNPFLLITMFDILFVLFA
jgi:hypothetical protein